MTTFSKYLQPWLAQANYVFKQLNVLSDLENYCTPRYVMSYLEISMMILHSRIEFGRV
jgi:hypothetical protein